MHTLSRRAITVLTVIAALLVTLAIMTVVGWGVSTHSGTGKIPAPLPPHHISR